MGDIIVPDITNDEWVKTVTDVLVKNVNDVLAKNVNDEFIKQFATASFSQIRKEIRKDIEEIINERISPKQSYNAINRKDASELLGVSPPTVDKYTEEGLLKKYGYGRRARYLLHEVEAARPSIMESLYRKEKPLHRRLRSNRQK